MEIKIFGTLLSDVCELHDTNPDVQILIGDRPYHNSKDAWQMWSLI